MEEEEKKPKRPRIGASSPAQDTTPDHQQNTDYNGGYQRPYNNYQNREGYQPRPYNRYDRQGGYQQRPYTPQSTGTESSETPTSSAAESDNQENSYGQQYNGGYQPRQNGYQPRQNNGYQPRQQNGYQPRQNNGYNRQGGYNNRQQNGYQPRQNNGYNQQGGYNNRQQNGYQPRQNNGYGQQGGYNNRQQNGYQPRQNNGYNQQGGYNNRQQNGYQPRQNNGYGQQGGYNNRQGGYNNRQQGGYQRNQGGFNNRQQGGFNRNQAGYNNRQNNKFIPRPRQIDYVIEELDPDAPIRLNKYMANAGICSRREADEYITAGKVKVNGETVTELGTKISRTDVVEYDEKIVTPERKCYVLLNKPKDCVTTSDDPNGRLTVMDLVKNACEERIYPVGRLDRNTTGVLLLTNDGELASKLTHPKYVKKKIYHVWTDKPIAEEDMQRIADGIELEDGEIHADAISYVADERNQAGIEIHSGRNRIVRRIFEHLGYRVTKLDRVYFAGLTKKNLPRGRWRYLTQEEVNFLRMGSFE